jgi:hypothetical protein
MDLLREFNSLHGAKVVKAPSAAKEKAPSRERPFKFF